MPNVDSHTPGLPCWVDAMVATSDQRRRLMEFFSALHGWTWDEGTAETGYYSLALCNGRPVLGLGESPDGQGKLVTYFATEDIAASCARASKLGANVFFGPMPVMELGATALASDPCSSVHGLWQAKEFAGFGVIHEPGAPGWFDNVSRDPERASLYYSQLLEKDLVSPNEGMRVLADGEQWFASVSEDQLPGRDPMWNPIYIVDSLDRARRDAVSAGASVVLHEMPVPGSAITVVAEPVMGTMLTLMGEGSGEPA